MFRRIGVYTLCNLGKKIVLFDDVYTTGTTIKNCINAIKKYSPKTIKVLILLNNDSEERMQIS